MNTCTKCTINYGQGSTSGVTLFLFSPSGSECSGRGGCEGSSPGALGLQPCLTEEEEMEEEMELEDLEEMSGGMSTPGEASSIGSFTLSAR